MKITKTLQNLLNTPADLRRKHQGRNLKVTLHNDGAVQSVSTGTHKPPAPWLLFFWTFSPAAPRDIFTQQLRKKKKKNWRRRRRRRRKEKSCDLTAQISQVVGAWGMNYKWAKLPHILSLANSTHRRWVREKKAVLRFIHGSRGLQKTLGLMRWIFSVLEMHVSALLFNSEADKIWNSNAGKVEPFRLSTGRKRSCNLSCHCESATLKGYNSVMITTMFFFSKASWKYRILSLSSSDSRSISLRAKAFLFPRAEMNLAANSAFPFFWVTRFT